MKDKGTQYYEENLFGERTAARQQTRVMNYEPGAVRQAKTPKKKEEVQKICMNCLHAVRLMQWGDDPVIADCEMNRKNPRMVARRCFCQEWKPAEQQREIEKME